VSHHCRFDDPADALTMYCVNCGKRWSSRDAYFEDVGNGSWQMRYRDDDELPCPGKPA
jgi:hypothetical protein